MHNNTVRYCTPTGMTKILKAGNTNGGEDMKQSSSCPHFCRDYKLTEHLLGKRMAESNKGEQMFYPMTQQFSANTQQIYDPKYTKDKHKHVHGGVVSVPQSPRQPGSSDPPPTYRWKVNGHLTLRHRASIIHLSISP